MKIYIVLIAFLLLGCEQQEGSLWSHIPSGTLVKEGPDEYGVVCYRRIAHYTLSCVKVK